MRRATIDAVLSYFDLLHRKCPTSISLRGVTSCDHLTLPLSLRRTGRRFHTFSCTHIRSHASKMATDNMRQLESLMHRLDQDRAAIQRPADTLLATPTPSPPSSTLPTILNANFASGATVSGASSSIAARIPATRHGNCAFSASMHRIERQWTCIMGTICSKRLQAHRDCRSEYA